MTLAQILAFLQPFGAIIEPVLLNLNDNTVIPDLQVMAKKVSSPDLQLLLNALITGLQAFADAEIKKL